jgi:hypothetical protein
MGMATHDIGALQGMVAEALQKSSAAAELHMMAIAAHSNNETQVTADIVLEPDLLNSLYRRGRRRLKDIQATCQVNAKLDKLRGILRLSGSETGVQTARHLISGLGGPRKAVKVSVWAELLRTRTLQEGTQAIVAQIQQESGCRIHIERSRHEVRLFGDAEAVVIAERLLHELDKDCTEATVPMRTDSNIAPALQSLAHSCGVTLRLDENQVAVLGKRDPVAKAVKELNSFLADPQLRFVHQPSKPFTGQGEEAAEATPIGSESDENDDDKIQGSACPTCGACPFCASCGAVTASLPQNVSCPENTAMPMQTPMAPYIGQQFPIINCGGMMQISAMVPQDMVQQGMVPAVCMIPENMAGQGVMGQPHNMQTSTMPSIMFPLAYA